LIYADVENNIAISGRNAVFDALPHDRIPKFNAIALMNVISERDPACLNNVLL